MSTLKSYPLLCICILLLTSTVIRWPAITDPVQGSHTWLSTHVIMTNQIWHSEGIGAYKFNPVYTYPAETNRNMRSLGSGLPDDQGNYYYVSYPPFSFYLSYLFFTVLLLKPNIVGLFILNILIQGLIAVLLYMLICVLFERKITGMLYTPALLASSLYIFSAQTLWCHVYMYFADTLVLLFWVAYLLLSFLIFKRDRISSRGALTLFFITNFLLIYTEWLGLFVSATLFMYALYRSAREPIYLRILLLIAGATLLALGLTLYQYAAIDGLEAFLDTSISKYADRNGINEHAFYFVKLQMQRVLSYYGHLPRANLMLIAAFFALFLISKKKKNYLTAESGFLFALTLIPILLHHTIFLQFSSTHDFSTLKASIPFCLLLPILYNGVDFESDKKITSIDKRWVFLPVFTLMMLLNIALFYSLDRSRFLYRYADTVESSSTSEQALFAQVTDDRTNGVIVFMGEDRAFSTQIQMLINKNVLPVSKRVDVINHLRTNSISEGKLYIFNTYGGLIGIETIRLD